jgi:hypothetical protein
VSRLVDPPAVWGVGLAAGAPWPVSPDDIADETDTAVELLRMLGLAEGGLVLIVSRLRETIHVAPVERAAGRLSARWSCADATAGDAFRTASLVRQLQPDVVIGVNATIVNAIDDPQSVFGSVPTVAATDATARASIPGSRWWLKLGPTNAFECAARSGAHYDGRKWLVERAGDDLTITNIASRHTPAVQLPCGWRGDVVDGVCECGSSWPRVRLREDLA